MTTLDTILTYGGSGAIGASATPISTSITQALIPPLGEYTIGELNLLNTGVVWKMPNEWAQYVQNPSEPEPRP